MNIGLYFGTFNPIHNGHLNIANYILDKHDIQAIWFVVTPKHPLEEKTNLADISHRIKMVDLSVEKNQNLQVCDVEKSLPQPYYTIDTLSYLKAQHPSVRFSLIMGADNLLGLKRWKNYQQILLHYPIWVYPRKGFDISAFVPKAGIKICQAPMMEVSATKIRGKIKTKTNLSALLHPAVIDYIIKNNLYHKMS